MTLKQMYVMDARNYNRRAVQAELAGSPELAQGLRELRNRAMYLARRIFG